MTPRIVVVYGAAHEVVDHVRAVRAAGDIPLVGDGRWPAAQREAVHDLVRDARPPLGAAWASLTSGSSGTPRVVLRTAASWEQSFPAVSALLDHPAAAERVVALPAPPSSSLTLFSVAHALSGGPRPVFPGHDGSLAEATSFHGTPQALRALLDSGKLPRVQTALVGGSRLDEGVRAHAESRGIRVIAYYGAAELSFVAVDDGTGLRPFPGVDLDVRHGELWVRSPFAALGYLGDGGPLRTDGAWATVGDLAELETGTDTRTLRLRGRADGAIITASATVIPEEVEAELRQIPAIADAVVFGYPAAGVGALVAAMLEPAPGSPKITTGSLRSIVSARLGPAHRPRIWFTGELPRTASGKPARAEVVRRALAGEVSRVAG
ncbi:class I adenylate-forming enzyme family protein [Promicromonospora soli]|uniref:Long-chain-fatty-acid--CoA ligase n=1 Tax=Promicromonospora soli TaxID=2035533 RepID=A0A919G745_9MICO|nr:class I adenylate-forming enzyme family protein [Promicromonospora soli]GHH78676.1 long-chain-fatty-acid--CoA ligase [Promicromonospora soli]